MSTKLSNIRDLGRYEHRLTKKQCNIKKGRNIQRGVDILFFLYRGVRMFITDKEFYEDYVKVTENINVSETEEQTFQQKMISWLEDRIQTTKQEIEISDDDMKIKKGCKLRGLKECLAYAKTH